MKNLSLKKFTALAVLSVFASVPAFAQEEPVCKVRTIGGGSFGISFTFWQEVSAQTLEECQEFAATLVGQTEVSEDPTDLSARPTYYRPWRSWYKWTSGGETIRGSFHAD